MGAVKGTLTLSRQAGRPTAASLCLYWLGQAGFWLRTGQTNILIDPYLSDNLASKYKGQKHAHTRMMAPPVTIEELPKPDLVLVTHAHTDHMDPNTLAQLHKRFPETTFVVPVASKQSAIERIGHQAPLVTVDAGDVLELNELTLTVFPAAHETLNKNPLGQHPYVGYGLELGGVKLFHSGDTIPFDELDALVENYCPDLALLPVNGRDSQRLSDGIPGNLTLDEAIRLARHAHYLIPHHWGMFSFNTLDPMIIDEAAKQRPSIWRPVAGEHFVVKYSE